MREMPKAGFYVFKTTAYPNIRYDKECIYTTGIRGKGGHKYCRDWGNGIPLGWATLLWSCVPTIKEITQNYDYYEHYEDIPKELGYPPFPT